MLREPNGLIDLNEIRYVRIYSPDEVTSVSNWNNVCTFLMNSCVKTLTYDDDAQAMSYVQKKTTLQFVMKSNVNIQRTCQIYRSNIIISLCEYGFVFFVRSEFSCRIFGVECLKFEYSHVRWISNVCCTRYRRAAFDVVANVRLFFADSVNFNQQFFELFILGPKKFLSKKMFNAWEEFNAYISCMFLYGNTFILGVDTGCVSVSFSDNNILQSSTRSWITTRNFTSCGFSHAT